MMIIIPGNSNMGVEVGSVGSEASINFLLSLVKKEKYCKLIDVELNLTSGCASLMSGC